MSRSLLSAENAVDDPHRILYVHLPVSVDICVQEFVHHHAYQRVSRVVHVVVEMYVVHIDAPAEINVAGVVDGGGGLPFSDDDTVPGSPLDLFLLSG